ncbi:MAG: hypothetical protein JF886_07875 [Candidatus Dormibacteraeota bacterium]|uniref:Uncharacterized protein n=1 Tax=Candidatus Aeolococcus gillhamiae TaxID=3127015 RepID=A0A2W5Z7M4_9BACT|nr:hypothetical protein [Candidatus Dormibacteraeota bacterium]PZR81332.1 MAG: hypothetical protein DLM65_06085 [Candidatus Dormibacter sp. RRmetagenome_bin12]
MGRRDDAAILFIAGARRGEREVRLGSDRLLTSSPSVTVAVDGSTQLVFWQGSGNTLWEGW